VPRPARVTELSFQHAIEEFRTCQVQVPHSIKISIPPFSNSLTAFHQLIPRAKRTISGTDNDGDDGADKYLKRCVFVSLHRALPDSSSLGKKESTSSTCSSTKATNQSPIVIMSENSDDGEGDTMTGMDSISLSNHYSFFPYHHSTIHTRQPNWRWHI
jgi:hypothetical protein